MAGVDVGEYEPAFYVPVEQRADAAHVLIRSGSDATGLIGIIRATLQGVAQDSPYIKIEPLSLYLDQQTHGWRVASRLFGIVAFVALLLAAVGTDSLLAFVVKQRTVEIGIRLAIGASPRDIVRMALTEGMIPVLIGIGIGVLGAAAVTRVMGSVVFAVSSADPLTIGASAILLLVIGFLACSIPAGAAALIDPARSLRNGG